MIVEMREADVEEARVEMRGDGFEFESRVLLRGETARRVIALLMCQAETPEVATALAFRLAQGPILRRAFEEERRQS